MRLKAILWDMDGTLIDSEPAHQQALSAAMTSLGSTVLTNIHDRLLGASYVEVHQVVREVTGLNLSLHEWNSLKWKYYLTYCKDIKLLKNRQTILDTLIARGVPMALVSNSTRDEVDLSLKVTDLNDYFHITVSRNDVAQGKPAPEGYLAAATALSIAPNQCLVIEDSVTGAKAGLAAGMTTLFHPETEALCKRCPQGAILLPPKESLSRWLTDSFSDCSLNPA
ncbi:HAD family phosphatase [Aliiglaciecola sp. LCG003]|uniref:HAD family hydrolase n=1 Tax=Aliiglaciecola sp. LCG003 TaxID=3053655 RepID=UPI0025738C21|nr:HAD family phosphatase [Aliiglaciecola sp. LCG003]WJG10621.1 HAD family phosphatase [Aliiglaciecola sp. LCG003]